MAGPELTRYRIIRAVGHGYSGVTYRARRLSDESLVAVKVFGETYSHNDVFKNACIRGAFAAKTLQSPSAAGVHECAEDSGHLVLAMEFVEGEPLARMLQRNVRFGEKDTAKLLLVLTRLIKAASENGLNHGNLHPGKVILTRDGRPVVIGTGLPVDEHFFRCQDNHPDGYTWPLVYQAPERLDVCACAPAESSDLYSIGAIGYHMLTGHTPFHSERLPSLRIEKVSPTEWPPTPFKNEALRVLVNSLLSPQPADRPSVEEAERVLAAAAQGLQVLIKEAPPVRILEPVPSAPLLVRDTVEEAPRRESPFMLPALAALLVLIVGLAALLKVFVTGPQTPEPKQTVVANTEQPVAPPAPATQVQPASVAPKPVAPAEPQKSPTELAAQELKAIEELTAQTGQLPPALRESLERIAKDFPNEVWGMKAQLLLSSARQNDERKSIEKITDLKARTRQALAAYRVKDALAMVDEMEKTAPASMHDSIEEERTAVNAEMPLMYARVRTKAEILAGAGDFAAAYIEYNKVIDGFPQGEWASKAQAAVDGLKEIEERKAAEAADTKKRELDKADKTTYETILRKAYDAATRFKYDEATSTIEQGFAALTDTNLKQGLSIYREIIKAEADIFETVSGRLARGDKDVMLHFPGEDNLTVVGIGSSGVALRRENLERMIYPWKRLSDYQQLRLFEMCIDETNAAEVLALASIAFHRGMAFEAENKLTAASNLNAKVKEKALTWRGLFNELEAMMRPVRVRNQQQ